MFVTIKMRSFYKLKFFGEIVWFVIFALFIGLQGCSSGNDSKQKTGHVPKKQISPEQVVVHNATAEQILQRVNNSDAQVIMLNVWATWCQPCKEEFPDLMRLRYYYEEQGLDLMLVSGDFPDQLSAVKKFLADQGVTFPTYIKTGKDMAFINTLNPDWSGALPATWIFDSAGNMQEFWQGKTSFDRMEQSILKVLNKNFSGREDNE